MNKRIRKKQLKRALVGLLDACDAYEAMWERIFREAKHDLVDAYAGPKEAFYAAFRRYMEVTSAITMHSGLPISNFLE